MQGQCRLRGRSSTIQRTTVYMLDITKVKKLFFCWGTAQISTRVRIFGPRYNETGGELLITNIEMIHIIKTGQTSAIADINLRPLELHNLVSNGYITSDGAGREWRIAGHKTVVEGHKRSRTYASSPRYDAHCRSRCLLQVCKLPSCGRL